jgi:hypothetical protein
MRALLDAWRRGWGVKSFGHKRPVRDELGEITGMMDCPAVARTVDVCGAHFGPDSERRLIVSLEAGDLVCVRPERTKRVYRVVAKDLFFWLLRAEANRVNLERARDVKARRAERLARARQERAERKLFNKVKPPF